MTDPAQLHRRAALVTQAAGSAVLASAHLERALIQARDARADLGVLHELETATAAIRRAIKRTELQRQRLLRKADRKEAELHA